jgi:hypothetical protein
VLLRGSGTPVGGDTNRIVSRGRPGGRGKRSVPGPSFGMGVRFLDLSGEARAAIEALVRALA